MKLIIWLLIAVYLTFAIDTFSDAIYVWNKSHIDVDVNDNQVDVKSKLKYKVYYFVVSFILSLLWIVWFPFIFIASDK